jgi:serine/threonine-protein kinase
VTIVVATAAAVLLTRGGDHRAAGPALTTTTAASRAPATTTTSTTTKAATPVSVDPARLPQMLLAADVISASLSSPGMVAAEVQSSADVAADSTITPLDCASTWAPGKIWTYQLSGFIGMARQQVAEQPTPNHAVIQAVLAFPDATVAKKSYDDQVKSWGKCQFQTVTAHLGSDSKDQTAVLGVVTESGGLATLQITPDFGLPGVVCERALTVAGNVVVDVRSCSPNVGDTAATLARDIAAKINARS